MKSGSPETRPSIAFDFEADNLTGRVASARAPSGGKWFEMGRAVGAGGQGAGTGTVEAR